MTDGTKYTLPKQFAALDAYLDHWNNPTMAAQYAARLNSNMNDMQDFYAAVKPMIPDIKTYLDSKDFSEYSESDRLLGRLLLAWVPVAEAVEVFKQAKVPDSKAYWEIVEEPHFF